MTKTWGSAARLVAAVATATLLATAVSTTTSAGEQSRDRGRAADFLALGDSVAFGFTPGAVTPPQRYLDARNFVGYPDDIARALGLRLANASCPGETTASLIDAAAPSNGCENAYRTTFPLHVEYTGAQLAFAVRYLRAHSHTRLVTINIGANDMFLCQKDPATNGCSGAAFSAALEQVSENLGTILATLRQQAHYRGELVLLSYYSLSYTDPTQVAFTKALNAALIAPAVRFHGTVADGFTAFQTFSAAAGGSPCTAGLLVPLPTGGCDIHPSQFGHLVLAQAVEEAVAPLDRDDH
jgi:lysophospholipase L1-like esterase